MHDRRWPVVFTLIRDFFFALYTNPFPSNYNSRGLHVLLNFEEFIIAQTQAIRKEDESPRYFPHTASRVHS